jgi:hypothetical protein
MCSRYIYSQFSSQHTDSSAGISSPKMKKRKNVYEKNLPTLYLKCPGCLLQAHVKISKCLEKLSLE